MLEADALNRSHLDCLYFTEVTIMIISVRNRSINKQKYPTSCWISASHFLLSYIGVNTSISTLHAEFYNPSASSALAMNGAGHPKRVLGKYAFDAGYFPDTVNPQATSKQQIVAAIETSIGNDIPVIAGIRSTQISGFGHAVVITAISSGTGGLGFKDPGTGSTPRPFGVDVRYIPYEEFINGFSYRRANAMQQNIFCFCTQFTYLRPINEMSLLD